jgi:hypothetical protein
MSTYSSQSDLMDDLNELLFHTTSKIDQLNQFVKFIKSSGDAVRPQTSSAIQDLVTHCLVEFNKLHADISRTLKNNDATSELKHEYADRLRAQMGVAGALLASTDWQSPSFLHSQFSQAGAQTGKISGNLNDYKRDHNIDAENYEHTFRSEYIDATLRIPPHVYTTSSGMAAFTTIVNTLHLDGIINGPVLAGRSCYFECKKILERFFGENLHYVDEMDVDALLAKVHELQPAVIFLDTLCNTEITDILNRARGPFNVSMSAQVAGIAALNDQEFIKQSKAHNTKWRNWLATELEKLGYKVYPSQGNFLLVEFGNAAAVDDHLRDQGIIVRRMEGYGLPTTLRITIGKENENKAVIAALSSYKK